MQRNLESKIDISQLSILPKLIQYLKLTKPDIDPVIVSNLIQQLEGTEKEKGYCEGFTAIAGYSIWLQFQTERTENTGTPIPRDDWKWFSKTLESIAAWDGQSPPSSALTQDIERLLSLIEYFHNIYEYRSIAQGDIHKSLEDTRERKPVKEYSLAGLLTLNNLETIIPQILHEDRIIYMTAHHHANCLFLHDDMIIFYDSNYSEGLQYYETNQIHKLAKNIFSAMEFNPFVPSPLGFKIFSFDGKPGTAYPLHNDLLSHLPLNSDINIYSEHLTALFMAAMIGCEESVKVYLKNAEPAYLNQTNNNGATPAYIAAQNDHAGVIRILAEKGADVDKANADGITPTFIAVQQGHAEVLRILAEKGADLDKASHAGITPSYAATDNNQVEMIRVLSENGADFNKTSDGISLIYFTAQEGNVSALRVLAGNRCGLLKIENEPRLFGDIESFLYGKDTILLHNDKLYYADVNKKEINELTQTELNHETYHSLKLACHFTYQDASCEQMNLITSMTGHEPLPSSLLDIPIEASIPILLKHATEQHREQEVKDLFKNISGDQLHGFTSLHAAIFFGHPEVVKELIALHFDIHRTTKENISGLDFAKAMNQVEIIKILQDAAARPEVKVDHQNPSTLVQKSIFPLPDKELQKEENRSVPTKKS